VRRRSFLSALSALAVSGKAAPLAHATPVRDAQVVAGTRLQFPRDFGAHPDFRIEWWYVTGWLDARDETDPRGFQITFFRARAPEETANPSRFAARQIIFAHAALADPRIGRLVHEERAAREALGLAGAGEGRTDAWLDDWRFEQAGQTGRGYRASIAAREFSLALEFDAAGEVMLQGEAGVSRKGPRPREASYYYSQPQMALRGDIVQAGVRRQVNGKAWLDHEWSSSYLAPEASGWDWTGINLADGGALTLFRMRARSGGVYYAGGTLRAADGRMRRFAPPEIRFEPLRRWRSPRTGVEYPVAMRIVAGDLDWRLEPLMDDQELDARASTGTIYWEGAVRAFANDAEVGRGYLELTGYWMAMKL